MKAMHFTQVTDTFIDGFKHEPLKHDTESAARNYAADITRRRRCDAVVFDQGGNPITVYQNGAEVGQTVTVQ